MSPEIEKRVKYLRKRGYAVEERGACLLIARPGQHLTSGYYVSLRDIEESGDPGRYITQALKEWAQA